MNTRMTFARASWVRRMECEHEEKIIFAAIAVLVVGFLGLLWLGRNLAGGISHRSVPDGYMPLNVIPVGYPAENPPAKDKWNPAKIHYDKW